MSVNYLDNVIINGALSASGSLSAVNFYGNGSNLIGVTLSLPASANWNTSYSWLTANSANATFTSSISTPNISANNLFVNSINSQGVITIPTTNIIQTVSSNGNTTPLLISASSNQSVYNQIQNLFLGASASTDLVLTNDQGIAYLDIGINSTQYNGNLYSPSFNITNPNDSYVYATGGNLAIGTSTGNNLLFFTGGTLSGNTAMVITSAGSVSAKNYFGNGSNLTGITASNGVCQSGICFIGGGIGNTASGLYSNVAGGFCNTASGTVSNVAGGFNNNACGAYSNVAGGCSNTASGYSSNVAGGFCNTASLNFSNVAGGCSNTASGFYSNVAGGRSNTASINFSNVAGGFCNIASGIFSNVAGGFNNNACGAYSNVAGGCSNTASGYSSNVAGGRSNIASGIYSNVVGGFCNNVIFANSNINGGISNTMSCYNNGGTATASNNTINGGCTNFIGLSSCGASRVSCLFNNNIGGGTNNRITAISNGSIITANTNNSNIGGGIGNCLAGNSSSIVGGSTNTLSANCAFIAGGNNNVSCGFDNTFILGSNLSASQANFTYVNNISAQGKLYGDGSNLINLPSSGGGLTNNVSVSSISAINYFGYGNQVILSDGYTNNNVNGNGASTLSMNFANGVYVGLSGSNPIYALGVPQYYTLQSTASSIFSGLPFFYNGFPQADYLQPAAQYEIEYVLYYQANAATTVTYALSSANQIAFVSSNYIQTAVGGIGTNGTASNAATLSAFNNGVTLPPTGSLTSGASANAIIKTYINTSVSATNIVLNINNIGNGITPLQGSYRKITRIS